MHGTPAEWSEREAATSARARAAQVSFWLIAAVLGVVVLAGLVGLAAIAMPAWAKFSILFAILTPAVILAALAVRRRGALAGARPESRSRLLRRAADAVDEPRAVMGPNGETIHANAAFVNLFRRSAGEGGDPVAGVFGTDPEQLRAFAKLCADAKMGLAGQASFPMPVNQGGPGIRRTYATPVPDHPGYIVLRIQDVPHQRNAAADDRDRFVALLDAIGLGYYEIDVNGRLTYCNATFGEWLGLAPVDLMARGVPLGSLLASGIPRSGAPYDPFGGRSGEGSGQVVLRGFNGRDAAVHIVQSVARDGPPGLLARAVVRDLSAERRWRQSLAESDERLQRLFDDAPIGLALIDSSGVIRRCNDPFRDLFGGDASELRGIRVGDLLTDESRDRLYELLRHALSGQAEVTAVDLMPRRRPNRVVAADLSRMGIDGEPLFILYGLDATEQRNLQTQVNQAQKMQAVGQLAGGIAHDFNNLLTAMIGYCDLVLQRHRPGEQSFADIMQIKQNANRAADLVKQLLAFSRQQTLKPKVLKVTDVLTDLTHLLQRLVGTNIKLDVVHSRDLGYVRVDQGQFQQVIVNLVVNARDAMPDGGHITVETKTLRLARPMQRGHELIPGGEFVQIDVIDEGTGITPENLQRIFEPFFTTKEVGRGTGLGLSTVYGIVKQTGGHVLVESEVGRGSTFTVLIPRYFPQSEAEETSAGALGADAATRDLTGAGRVLVVEDEDPVRAFSVRALRNKGYTVMEARTGLEALEVLTRLDRPVDLIVTDVMMPQMDGPSLIKRVREKWPQIKVICISGYAEESFRDKIGSWDDIWFLPKPYSLNQLAGLVKDAIGAGKRAA
jgi:two-component system cell cycle sensor histidine kinase/response regulator CckA